MAEAEDVIVDAARHATVFTRNLWFRQRNSSANAPLELGDIAERLSLLITAVFGRAWALRKAQSPAPLTLLQRLFKRHEQPFSPWALPATDGETIWLPQRSGVSDTGASLVRFRCMALQQATRAVRRSPLALSSASSVLAQSIYVVLDAHAADVALARMLPGMAPSLRAFRSEVLALRPSLAEFPPPRRRLEAFVRKLLSRDSLLDDDIAPSAILEAAETLAATWLRFSNQGSEVISGLLYQDLWTGELRTPTCTPELSVRPSSLETEHQESPRSARLARRPDVREPQEEEDNDRQGAWMIQTTQPHEHAEDPIGIQRPTDRDEQTAAEEYADSLSELPEARLVTTPGAPKEVLLSDEPPQERTRIASPQVAPNDARFIYPEWDWRIQAYREPGAIVHVRSAPLGPLSWVEQTLSQHRRMLDTIRRRFEMLQAHRQKLRKQYDGDEPDLDAYVDAYADLRAGRSLPQNLYQTQRAIRRDLAIGLLIDISGSADSWIGASRRVIDVERETLLLVCVALEGLRAPFNVLAFSGEGPSAVTISEVKCSDEPYSMLIAQRIAALEPERYTRAGAAIRHATAELMKEPARHRLLLLLSDGKPNDVDEYDGRYGVEDMRQAVTEAKRQGLYPFCLTIDRQAANYLPQVFGVHQYTLLSRPELLPTVLLDWMKKLVSS